MLAGFLSIVRQRRVTCHCQVSDIGIEYVYLKLFLVNLRFLQKRKTEAQFDKLSE